MEHDSSYWNSVAVNTPQGQDYDILLAEHYRQSHLDLLFGWADFDDNKLVLKTDLFAEGMCPARSFAWDIIRKTSGFLGIDISPDICRAAKDVSASLLPEKSPDFAACDLRKLPFKADTFDIIISDSSLDHYADKKDIDVGITELVRCLKPGGTLIITMDNKANITEPLFRLWIRLKLAPFFIGKTYSIKELIAAVNNAGLEVKDSRTLIHNPRFFAKQMIAVIRKLFPHRSDAMIKKRLAFYDSLEKRRTRLWTAQFIAVKAVKPAE